MTSPQEYSYRTSLKSDLSDEPLNTYLVRPLAGVIVRLLYRSPVSADHLTLLSTGAGLLAAAAFLCQGFLWAVLGGVFVELKDVLDSADGQLARARGTESRAGRFLDSIGDFVANILLVAAVSVRLYEEGASTSVFAIGAASFLCMTLRVSFHVYYHTAYLHLSDLYTTNRLTETITTDDRTGEGRLTIMLHRVYLALYGWQDTLMASLDRWMLSGRRISGSALRSWYGDLTALRLGGFLGLATELFVLALCAFAGLLDHYFTASLVGLNTIWLGTIIYRRFVLAPMVEASARL